MHPVEREPGCGHRVHIHLTLLQHGIVVIEITVRDHRAVSVLCPVDKMHVFKIRAAKRREFRTIGILSLCLLSRLIDQIADALGHDRMSYIRRMIRIVEKSVFGDDPALSL